MNTQKKLWNAEMLKAKFSTNQKNIKVKIKNTQDTELP